MPADKPPDTPRREAGEEQSGKPIPEPLPFPIVGVAASAGGLEAFTELLEGLPADPGIAFLFVLHLDPHRKSQLAEVLSGVTSLEVIEAAQGMRIERNHVYLIPPDTNMGLTDSKLRLSPRSPMRGEHMPADHLFRSLAQVQRSRAVGVILSGGGTDGSLGFQTIKAEGGITFAQSESSARQSSMPRSAVADGNVDYVLTPAEIGRELVRVTRHPYSLEPAVLREEFPETGDVVNDILSLLRSATGVDFSHYKRTTIRRRILRRMALRGLQDPGQYLRLLHDEAEELQSLYQDLLIRVTQFFRDPEAYEALKEKVFPQFLQRPPDTPIRLWVTGCATGEEVYSLAIVLFEFLDTQGNSHPVKILATDLNDAALGKARSGVFLDNIEIDVSPERLRRFFVKTGTHYQISKAVRDVCVFSRHNMAGDAPFSHIDLVSCRNVLIYMDSALQRRVLPSLHYALNPDGYLFLGSSESIGAYGELFLAIDSKHRLFMKRQIASAIHHDFISHGAAAGHAQRPAGEDAAPLWTALDVQREADRIVVSRYAPVGVVVDDAGTVVQFRGRTAPYLEPAPGMASLDLLRMLRQGLLADVRGALNQARIENKEVVKEGVRGSDGTATRQVKVEVIPFKIAPANVRFFLVLFQDMPEAGATAPAPARPAAAEQPANQLQQELAAVREYLQSVIEEHEATNEELKSANEEILSSNEELQSTNEELQTAKEEAQSANEELATVNEELQHRNLELSRVNSDLMILLTGVNMPIVMVGRELRIRRFTPLAEKLFNLILTDIGRPISDIKPNLSVQDLPQLIAKVIDTLAPYENLVKDKENRSYVLRIRPAVTLDNKIDGASIVLLDIDSAKRVLDAPPG
ncbi:MAG TPA: chemotaxis protein CheB [Gemmataceae bacterium]|nr:chemotaxis protein CheB [Gemmataceae bacterium]